jgi:hypothetical protein
MADRLRHVGTWLSLVEHSLGVRGVGSSNLPVPTNSASLSSIQIAGSVSINLPTRTIPIGRLPERMPQVAMLRFYSWLYFQSFAAACWRTGSTVATSFSSLVLTGASMTLIAAISWPV